MHIKGKHDQALIDVDRLFIKFKSQAGFNHAPQGSHVYSLKMKTFHVIISV